MIFAVFRPFKMKPLFPLHLAIATVTWSWDTHAGMVWYDEEMVHLVNELHKEGAIPLSAARREWVDAGQVVSATWPKVRFENLWHRYVGYKVWLGEVKLPDWQGRLVREYWLNALKKGKRYSIRGLGWYLAGRFVGPVTGFDKDVDPRGAFCSEATTNSLYRAGVRVFNFLGDQFERALLRARRMDRYDAWMESLSEEEKAAMARRGLPPQVVWRDKYVRWFWGYKVSPRMFKMSPVLRPIATLTISKRGVWI